MRQGKQPKWGPSGTRLDHSSRSGMVMCGSSIGRGESHRRPPCRLFADNTSNHGTRQHRATFQNWANPTRNGPFESPLEQIARLVLAPLREHFGAMKTWCSVRWPLWLVPCGRVAGRDGQYAIEKHSIRYVVSGRDLVSAQRAASKTSEPVILADPNFDLTPQEAAAASRAGCGRRTNPSLAQECQSHSRQQTAASRETARHGGRGPAIAPKLESTPGENRSCSPKNTLWRASSRKSLAQKWPSSAPMGSFCQSRKHSATRPPSGGRDTPCAVLTTDGKPVENPLFALRPAAGCLQSSGGASGRRRRILTGLEIVGTDLRGRSWSCSVLARPPGRSPATGKAWPA